MLQVKETGNLVDFTNGKELNLQDRLFQDDVFGVYAYQESPIVVDATTRNALFSGDLLELQTQSAGQGMEIQYMRISWNETQTASGEYHITDFVVGVAAKVIRDFNTGPAYLIDALKAVKWLNQVVSKMVMPWKSWLLLKATRIESYKTCQNIFVSEQKYLSSPIGKPLPDLPSAELVKNQIIQEGAFNDALGEFVIKMLDEGYTITIFGYQLQVCFERGEPFRSGTYTHTYGYKVHVRFSWDFTSDPDFTVVEDTQQLLPGFVTATFILSLVKLVGIIIVGSIIAYNLTRKESGYVEYEVLRDAEGNPIFDENGDPIVYPSKQGWDVGPPDWWQGVITTVVLGGLLIAGLVVVVPRLIKSLKKQ